MTLRSNNKAAFAFSALAIGMTAYSTQVMAAEIQGITASQSSVNVTQMRINFDGTPVVPVPYQEAGSNQLILDFNQVNTSLPRNTMVNTGIVDDVIALSNGNATRLMVGLNSKANFKAYVEGRQFVMDIIDIDPKPTTASVQVPENTMQISANPLLVPSNAAATINRNEGIVGVNYSANSAGGGDISLNLSSEAISVDVQRQGNKIVVRTTGAMIPKHLVRSLNAGGLVATIDASNQGKNGILTINMSDDYEYQAYQTGAQVQIAVRPATQLTEPTIEEKIYTGEPLSMEFQDVPVRTVLDVLAGFTEQNIVANDSVAGNITLRLINVPWDQALDIILKSRDLDKRVNGNVILVAPAKELAEQETAALKAASEVKDLAPLRTETFRLNYANVEKLYQIIEESKGGRGNSSALQVRGSALLSPRGSIIRDERTNTLIVTDTAQQLATLRETIAKIDIPVKQVMIEARIVTATDNFSKQLGVRWGVAMNRSDLQVGGSNKTLWDMRANQGANRLNRLSGSTITTSDGGNNMAVDLGVGAATGRLALGILNIGHTLLDLELSAMQGDSRGEVLSAPKILTQDKQKARLSSGQQIPYQEAAASGATATTFKEASLVLEVTPNITPEGKIGMALMIKKAALADQGAINEQSIETNVVLEDGQTVVLGGVYEQTSSQGISKVPFLGDLPYVGKLFRKDERLNAKQELLIFVTPKLVNDGVSRID